MTSDSPRPRASALSRRQFIAAATGAGLGLAAGVHGAPGAAPAPSVGAAGPRLKLSLNAFSFLELLEANGRNPAQGIDLFRVCTFCAEQGFDGVDVTGYFFPGYPAAPAGDYLVRLKRHVFDLGLGFSGTGVRNDFTAADPAVRAAGVARIKTWIEVAARLGAPTVRAFADSQPPFRNWTEAARGASRETVEGWVADALRECARHGEQFGVIVAVQNHGDFITSGPEHLQLIGRVDHGWCRPLVDTGKYLTPDPYADIALVAPHAVNWQIKETTQSTLNSPRVDLPRLAAIIRRSGYRGYLPIETLRMGRADYDSYRAIPAMLAELRAALAAAG